jgi:predicted nucleotidyltransferase
MKTIDQGLLDETVRRIVAALQPQTIYLYGSHAYGQPHQDSDVDLLVVVRDSALPPHRRAVAAYRALRGLFLPAEVKVVTQAEFERRARWQSSIERIVLDRGKVLYESAS